MGQRHRVFISYHHSEADEPYRRQFETLFDDKSDILDSQAVQLGDIDPGLNTEYIYQTIRDKYVADATVTVVLIGSSTWQRKYVDWEIYSSLRDTKNNPRNGLLGILLPTFGKPGQPIDWQTVPPRLYDNLTGQNPFAKVYWWSTSAAEVQGWIHTAFLRRDKEPPPNNGRVLFSKNRTGDNWQP